MTDRTVLQQEFLKQAGWNKADAMPISGDASTRSYQRLSLNGQKAVLMNAPPGAETAACPPDATPRERHLLGYNARARLAGPNLNAFTELAGLLREAGVHAPAIFEADPVSGFALIEDLGDDLYARAIPAGADEAALYTAAIDVLAHLHNTPLPRPESDQYTLLDYDHTAMMAEAELLVDWYWSYLKGGQTPVEVKDSYNAVWQQALQSLSTPHTFVLRDYHAENVLWLGDSDDPMQRVGVIDFQDGLYGHGAYDIVSLLEDARRDVSAPVVDAAYERYIEKREEAGAFDREQFDTDLAILAAQRNAKILGIFARLIVRDNKPRYADFMPRVRGHFARDLERPAIAPLKQWMTDNMPELLTP